MILIFYWFHVSNKDLNCDSEVRDLFQTSKTEPVIQRVHINLLCHFEDAKEAQSSQARKAKCTLALTTVDENHFEDGSSNDGAVEAIKGWRKVDKRAKGKESDHHFEDESTQEREFGVNCGEKKK